MQRSCRVTQTQLNDPPTSPPAVWLDTIINMFGDGVNLQLHEKKKKQGEGDRLCTLRIYQTRYVALAALLLSQNEMTQRYNYKINSPDLDSHRSRLKKRKRQQNSFLDRPLRHFVECNELAVSTLV